MPKRPITEDLLLELLRRVEPGSIRLARRELDGAERIDLDVSTRNGSLGWWVRTIREAVEGALEELAEKRDEDRTPFPTWRRLEHGQREIVQAALAIEVVRWRRAAYDGRLRCDVDEERQRGRSSGRSRRRRICLPDNLFVARKAKAT